MAAGPVPRSHRDLSKRARPLVWAAHVVAAQSAVAPGGWGSPGGRGNLGGGADGGLGGASGPGRPRRVHRHRLPTRQGRLGHGTSSRRIGYDAGSRQWPAAAPLPDHITDRRDRGSGHAGTHQHAGPPATAWCQRSQHPMRQMRHHQAADPHREAGDRVRQFVVPRPGGARRGRVFALPEVLGDHGADETGDGEHGQIDARHGGLLGHGTSVAHDRRPRGVLHGDRVGQSLPGQRLSCSMIRAGDLRSPATHRAPESWWPSARHHRIDC